MDIHSQNEGKIYLPSPPYQDGKIYVPQTNTVETPSWSSATPQSPPSKYQPGAYIPYNHPPPPSPEEGERKILGLRKTTFILSVIIAILALALALGLGLGLGMKKDGEKDSNSTALGANNGTLESSSAPTGSTTTGPTQTFNPSASVVTVTQAASTGLPTVLALDCPSPVNPSPTVKLEGPLGKPVTSFQMNCGMDNAGFDIVNIMAYSFDDCMRACAMYNWFSRPQQCVGVQFWAPISSAKKAWDGNCFLKNGTMSKIENKQGAATVWAKIVA
ncbi:hypothetical protein QBC43DRAFT_373922 [Cladorrhinum sp. PSN259]|nr:hypothetical protein QBC43DRAFT_373922 [Cladorrhinum sp. PSN259]